MNENSMAGEWEQGSGKKIQRTVGRWWERSSKWMVGCSDGEDSGWDCGQVPNECRRGIGKQDIGFGNGLDDDKNSMLGGSVDGWKGVGLGSCLRSTKTLRVEERVLHQT